MTDLASWFPRHSGRKDALTIRGNVYVSNARSPAVAVVVDTSLIVLGMAADEGPKLEDAPTGPLIDVNVQAPPGRRQPARTKAAWRVLFCASS